MKRYLEESKCLASLAVFRELYDSQKDIYGIISEFLKEIIVSKAKHQFTLTGITQLLNDEFDFSIPEAVVKTSLKRLLFLSKYKGVYIVNNQNDIPKTANLISKQTKIKQNNDLIINNLFEFIESEKNTKLNDQEKEKIVHSFCMFILDDSASQEYSEYISAFIIKNKMDNDFTSKLSIIKEGVVLYSGLNYNINPSELGTWNSDLTIYLDTEILFHLAGYNGELYRTLFNDFYSFVKEINLISQQKYKKNRIHLKYFSEIKDEIENFFKKAEIIINGRDKPNPSVTAMTAILDGCHTPSDIIGKKTAFYQLLQSYGIQQDDNSLYYHQSNNKYNIEDTSVISALATSTGIEDVAEHLKFLNYINIHRRGGSSKNFENIGYIFLTGNSKTLRIAFEFERTNKSEGSVPLATSLSFLTNKFWFKLNKGFGNNNFPKNFDIVTKAQVLLSTQLNDSVGKKYEDLQIKFKNGDLTEEQAVATIAELRKQAKLPEDINENDISDVLVTISESRIECYLQEKEKLKTEARKQEEQNKKLKDELTTKEEEIKQKELELLLKNKELNKYKEAEKERLIKRQRRKKLLLKSIWTLLLIVLAIVGILLYIHKNKILGVIMTVIGLLSSVITILNFFNNNFKTICTNKK